MTGIRTHGKYSCISSITVIIKTGGQLLVWWVVVVAVVVEVVVEVVVRFDLPLFLHGHSISSYVVTIM